MTSKPTAVRLSRHFEAPPERLFDAWLDPAIAGRWLFTSPTSESHHVESDARVGGRWKITDRREGTDYTAIGAYEEIDRPRRLVFTFGMPQFSEEMARVTVEIEPQGAGSLLSLTHESVPAEHAAATEKGWAGMFDALRLALAAPSGPAVVTPGG
jgi:uncharacterized protein YndB with AHSA1/START domain